jgi:hypothetical protein
MRGRTGGGIAPRWWRVVGIVGLLAVLNLLGFLLSTLEPGRSLPGGAVLTVLLVSTAAPAEPPPPALPSPRTTPPGRDFRGGPPIRGIVVTTDGRAGWQFPRGPREEPGRPLPPPQVTTTYVVRPIGISRPGLEGGMLYLAALTAAVGTGFVLLLLAPGRLATTSAALTTAPVELARLAAIGAIAVLGALALTVLLVIIVTGIPLALALAAALSVALLFGFVAVASRLGSRLLSWARLPARHLGLPYLLGTLLLLPLAALPVVGWVVAGGVACLGLGAALLTRFGSDNPFRQPFPAPPQAGESV